MVRKWARVHTVVLSSPQVWFVYDDGCKFLSRCSSGANPKVLYVHITELLLGPHTCLSAHVVTWLGSWLKSTNVASLPTNNAAIVIVPLWTFSCLWAMPPILSRSPASPQLVSCKKGFQEVLRLIRKWKNQFRQFSRHSSSPYFQSEHWTLRSYLLYPGLLPVSRSKSAGHWVKDMGGDKLQY